MRLFVGLAWAAALLPAQDCAALLDRARSSYQARDFAAAAQHFESAARACPQRRAAILIDAARARMMAQQFAAAAEALAEVVKSEPRNAAALKLRGDALYLAGDVKGAEASLLAAIGADPRSPEPHYALGRIYYQETRYADSAAQFQAVLAIDPKHYRALDNLGLAYEGLNDVPKAMDAYGKALALVHQDHREYDWVYGNVSNLMYNQGDYQKSFQFASEAASRNPRGARNFFLAGKALAKLGRAELAVKWLGQAVALDPNYPEARYQHALALRKLGRAEEAGKQMDAFREINARQPRRRK